MVDDLTVTTERVDDIPILLSQAKKMGIPDLLDDHFRAHGNKETVFGSTDYLVCDKYSRSSLQDQRWRCGRQSSRPQSRRCLYANVFKRV